MKGGDGGGAGVHAQTHIYCICPVDLKFLLILLLFFLIFFFISIHPPLPPPTCLLPCPCVSVIFFSPTDCESGLHPPPPPSHLASQTSIPACHLPDVACHVSSSVIICSVSQRQTDLNVGVCTLTHCGSLFHRQPLYKAWLPPLLIDPLCDELRALSSLLNPLLPL